MPRGSADARTPRDPQALSEGVSRLIRAHHRAGEDLVGLELRPRADVDRRPPHDAHGVVLQETRDDLRPRNDRRPRARAPRARARGGGFGRRASSPCTVSRASAGGIASPQRSRSCEGGARVARGRRERLGPTSQHSKTTHGHHGHPAHFTHATVPESNAMTEPRPRHRARLLRRDESASTVLWRPPLGSPGRGFGRRQDLACPRLEDKRPARPPAGLHLRREGQPPTSWSAWGSTRPRVFRRGS